MLVSALNYKQRTARWDGKLSAVADKFGPCLDYISKVLTAKAQYSLGNAEKYFKEHLSAGDYYA